MENRQTYAACCALMAAAAVVAGCQSSEVAQSGVHRATPSGQTLRISQATVHGVPRFTLCAEGLCPVPTVKTKATVSRPSLTSMPPATRHTSASTARQVWVDIPFPFDGARLRQVDRLRLRQALATAAPDRVTIIGRSDWIGSAAARRRIALARARAVRDALLEERPGIAIAIKQEVSTRRPANNTDLAAQRRATVQLTPSSHQP